MIYPHSTDLEDLSLASFNISTSSNNSFCEAIPQESRNPKSKNLIIDLGLDAQRKNPFFIEKPKSFNVSYSIVNEWLIDYPFKKKKYLY
jgi:hypothetical protein